MSREELEWRYTHQKQQKKGEYKDTNTAAVQQKIRELENQIVDLSLEREDFEVTTLSQKLHKNFEIIDQLIEDKG